MGQISAKKDLEAAAQGRFLHAWVDRPHLIGKIKEQAERLEAL